MPRTLHPLLKFGLFTVLSLLCFPIQAQYVFRQDSLPQKISVHPYAEMVNVGNRDLSIGEIIARRSSLGFKSVGRENADLGFSTDNFWVVFSLRNDTSKPLEYYLETARPITDLVELYVEGPDGHILKSVSGDDMPCSQRSYCHRKTIFRIDLSPNSTKDFYIHMRSDGEAITLPLMLRTSESLMQLTSMEQFVFGIFYGILAIAAIVYIFFFFGIREKTFLYYGFYVIFIGIMQLAIDGYFYQYITPEGGWFSRRSVLIFASIAAFFLGRYSQVFLDIKRHNLTLNRLFNVIYGCLALSFLLMIVSTDLSPFYPAANIFGLIILMLIIASLASLYIKKIPVDRFFTTGICFLVGGFIIFILNNFGQIPTSFFSQNSSKFGTGFEVIFLSLSMANFIARLKNEKEDLNRLALQRAEDMSDMKTYFLSNISHELRTPLNAIMSLSADMAKTAGDERIRHDSQVIKYSSHSLLSSVNDILDFSKIEKGELRLEAVNFEPVRVLEHIRNNMASRAKDQGLEFRYEKKGDIPELLSGDVTRLGQIVNNVLSNAIKFTPEGFVGFAISAQPRPGNKSRLQLVISDSGVGITKEKIKTIFDSFTQNTTDNKRKFGGLGLGLYIVKTLVDMHDAGTIKITSKPGEGTICKITLDYDIVAMTKPGETDGDTPIFDLHGKNILVVEDNAINQMVIKMIAKKWLNTTMAYANNGQEGLDALKKEKFDLILMDLQMPIMDGYEATIAIRKGEAGDENKNIPIIAVTADVMESTKVTVREIGMNDYLSKPLKSEVLFEAVKRLL